jgi:tripartite-type tricarboxylate transporter receptor subunit TctC
MLRAVHIGLTASILIASTPAVARDDYPSRAVQIVVPFVAGGNTDILTRIMAEHLQTAFKQPFTVVNRPGAGTNIGAASVASSDPDGYTLLVAPPASHVINQYIYSSLQYDPEKSFTPITMVASYPNVLVVPPSLGVKSIQELIDKAKSSPGKLNYASAGIGSTSHLAAALFGAMAGVEINHVPYRGTAQTLQDLITGRVDMTIDNLGPILPFIRSGQLIALGVSTRDPVSLLPDIAPIGTVLKGYELSSWNALSTTAGTPRSIIDKLSEESNRILRKPDVAEKMRSIGSEPIGGTSDDVAKFFAEERVRWKQAVEAAKIPKM